MKKLLMTSMVILAAGCSAKLTNTSLTLDSIPPGVARLHIKAPDLLVEGHFDPVKGIEAIVDGVVGTLGLPPAP